VLIGGRVFEKKSFIEQGVAMFFKMKIGNKYGGRFGKLGMLFVQILE